MICFPELISSSPGMEFSLYASVISAIESFSVNAWVFLDLGKDSKSAIYLNPDSSFLASKQPPDLVALHGFGRSGKDLFGQVLVDEFGYVRNNPGDIIKKQLDELIKKYFGCSAFSETQKHRFRKTLESWGDDNFENIFNEYFKSLSGKTVNTRLMRIAEAIQWKALGGAIILIARDGQIPATEQEPLAMNQLVEHKLFDGVVVSNSKEATQQAARVIMGKT